MHGLQSRASINACLLAPALQNRPLDQRTVIHQARLFTACTAARDIIRHDRVSVRALETDSTQDAELAQRDPEDVRGAIAVGLQLYEQKDYQEALKVFEKALKLPGTGLKRYRDKPRLISDGEKQSVLYNIACCYSRLEDSRTGLVALAGCLETGYDNIDQLKSDPDLEFLRKDPRFDGLLKRFNLSSEKAGFFDSLLKGFNL